jgi:hypothetical protein
VGTEIEKVCGRGESANGGANETNVGDGAPVTKEPNELNGKAATKERERERREQKGNGPNLTKSAKECFATCQQLPVPVTVFESS